MTAWLMRYPLALPSDDALFFMRGLQHFSVLEFSPHFPGYPGVMLLGRLWALISGGDPLRALWLTSLSAALVLPVAMAWAVSRLGGRPLLAYALGLTLPLLSSLGLSLLSDSLGILCLVLFFGAVAGSSWRWWAGAGAALGMALACRPSAGVFVVAAGGLALLWAPQIVRESRVARLALLAGAAAVVLPLFGVVFALEGWLYVEEGWRFFQGHLHLWGQTVLSDTPETRPRWGNVVHGLPGGKTWALLMAITALSTLVSAVRLLWWFRNSRLSGAFFSLLGTWLVACLWTFAFQNPDNPRHLAPVLVLLLMLLAALPWRWSRGLGWLLVAVQASMAWFSLDLRHSPEDMLPPVAAAAHSVGALAVRAAEHQRPVPVLVTNYGLAVLHAALPSVLIADAYYRNDAASLVRTSPGCVLRLSSQASGGRSSSGRMQALLKTFPGRFWGEPSLYLYGTGACFHL